MAVSDTACSSGVGNVGNMQASITRRLDIIPGHHNEQHLQNSAS